MNSSDRKVGVTDLNINTAIHRPYQSSLATMHIENEFYGASDKFLFSVHLASPGFKTKQHNILHMKIIFSGKSNMSNYQIATDRRKEMPLSIYFLVITVRTPRSILVDCVLFVVVIVLLHVS